MMVPVENMTTWPDADVCIVGAGAAGVELADELSLLGHQVLLLESGDKTFSTETQALHEMESVGLPIRAGGFDFNSALDANYAGLPRVRQLGGTLNAWSGKWKPLDDDDFGEHPITSESWPIGFKDLAPSYSHVERKYGLPNGIHSGALKPKTHLPVPLNWSTHFEQVPPLRLRDRAIEIAQRKRVTLVTGAHVVGFTPGAAQNEIAGVKVVTDEGDTLDVKARAFVLAAGGLEVTRLLLIGVRAKHLPRLPHLGEGFMDHPKVMWGTLKPAVRWARQLRGIEWETSGSGRVRSGFGFSWEFRQKHGLPRHATLLVPRPAGSRATRAPAISKLARAVADREPLGVMSSFAEVVTSATGSRQAFNALAHRMTGVVFEYEMQHYMEQLPNPNSAIKLSTRRDRLGAPLLQIDWQLTAEEGDRFFRHVKAVKDVLEHSRLARVDLSGGCTFPSDLRDASHHMGTTRMASKPSDGVVNVDARLHGIKNLFVSSSSIFPLGSSANPTFTILALAHRLALHLHHQLSGPPHSLKTAQA